jgi:CRP/FNR family transcriptional regulator
VLTETDVEAVAVPRTTFDELIATSPTFRRFVFTHSKSSATSSMNFSGAAGSSRRAVRSMS